jgi:DHA2 family multidrug resistance protein
LRTKGHFLGKELFKERNFLLSTIMLSACGFVLLPTLALTSPVLEELVNNPVETTGHMTMPRGILLVGALVLVSLIPAWLDNRLFVTGSIILTAYANWQRRQLLAPMDWPPLVATGLLQGRPWHPDTCAWQGGVQQARSEVRPGRRRPF